MIIKKSNRPNHFLGFYDITAPPSSPGVAICWECIGVCIEAVTTVYEYNAILATEAQPS
jgi:hypothetical protein